MTTTVEVLPDLRDPAAAGPYRVATLERDVETTSWAGESRPLHTFV